MGSVHYYSGAGTKIKNIMGGQLDTRTPRMATRVEQKRFGQDSPPWITILFYLLSGHQGLYKSGSWFGAPNE